MAQDISDIYIRSEKDPLFNSGVAETTSFIDGVVAKLHMILFTRKGEVFGDPEFGADIPTYLWKTRFPASTIQNEVEEQIQRYCPELSSNMYTVRVYIVEGTHQDVGVVEVNLGTANVSALFK